MDKTGDVHFKPEKFRTILLKTLGLFIVGLMAIIGLSACGTVKSFKDPVESKNLYPDNKPSMADVQTNSAEKVIKADKQAILKKTMKLQMPFIANEGQVDKEVSFYAKTFGGTAYVTQKGEMVYSFSESKPKDKAVAMSSTPQNIKGVTLKETLVGASVTSSRGDGRSQTKVNYFIGNDKNKWKTDIHTYNSISLGEVYKGIDLSLKAYGKTVEKVFTVQPGADPKNIKLEMEGANSIKVNEKGELELGTDLGEVRFSKPIAYQERNGKRENVQVAYCVDKGTYGFTSGPYDRSLPLVIDPVLSFSTFLGGTSTLNGEGYELGYGIALDSDGNAYVTGYTTSADFPTTTGAYQEGWSGNDFDNTEAYVVKIDPDTPSIIYSTYLGGIQGDVGWDIAVDASGNAYVTGTTQSSLSFPLVSPIDSTYGGTSEAFVTKIAPGGNALVYSTFLGGSGSETGMAIKVSDTNYVYVAGSTNSTDFLVTHLLTLPGGAPALPSGVPDGSSDIFLTYITSSGTTVNFSTYLGGTGSDSFGDMQITWPGQVWITGTTDSADFPIWGSAQHPGDNDDVFVTRISALGHSIMNSSIIGGSGQDGGRGINVDSDGNAYVTGYTYSADFPTLNPPVNPPIEYGGWKDAFVMKITSISPSIVYSTFLGGSGGDEGSSIAVDSNGNMFVTGITDSDDFPLVRAGGVDDSYGGGSNYPDDIFVTAISSDGAGVGYSTYLSGTGDCHDHAYDIAVDSSGSAYVTGYTSCSDFPAVNSLYTHRGLLDVIVAKIDLDPDDIDGDLIPDSDDNCPYNLNSDQLDSDSDAFGDACDGCDFDPAKTSPGICGCGVPEGACDEDDDGDGMPNDWETGYGLNPNDPNDAYQDPDRDGLENLDEFNSNTQPHNPDTDGDKLSDGYEVSQGSDPTDNSSKSPLPIRWGNIMYAHEAGGGFATYLIVAIGNEFVGSLPNDITEITVSGPSGIIATYSENPGDWTYYPNWREFFTKLDVPPPPETGTYAFTVTADNGALTGTVTDTQYANIDIAVPDPPTFVETEAGILSSKDPTFFWNPVSPSPGIPLYYRLDIVENNNGQPGAYVYNTNNITEMSHTLPNNVLNLGESYLARVRANDAEYWTDIQNRANSGWVPFTVERDPKRLYWFQVTVYDGELYSEFSVIPGFRRTLETANLETPGQGNYSYDLSETGDYGIWDTECRYSEWWGHHFGSVSPSDYGDYILTLKFSDGAQEVYTRTLQEAIPPLTAVTGINVTVYDDGNAWITWDRPPGDFNYQVRVRDSADKEYYRAGPFYNEDGAWLWAWDLRCLTKGETYRWQVRVYDLNGNATVTQEVSVDYAPASLRHTEQYSAWDWKEDLALGFNSRPGSRGQVDWVSVTGPGFTYSFDKVNDWSPMATETRLGMDMWWVQDEAWPITPGDYTFTADYTVDGEPTITEEYTTFLNVTSVEPVGSNTLSFDIKGSGAIVFSWDLPVDSGQAYYVSVRNEDGTKEYYRSSTLNDAREVTASFWDLRGLEHGQTYQWFVRSAVSGYRTLKQSESVYFVYNPFDWNDDGDFDVYQDSDEDEINDGVDNCVDVDNPGQADLDADGIGDACDDTDWDGTFDADDPCPFDPNNDADQDGVCENSIEICNTLVVPCGPQDLCPDTPDGSSVDADGCAEGQTPPSAAWGDKPCKTDCPVVVVDEDKDGKPDAEEPEICLGKPDCDGDGVNDGADNCIQVPNGQQENSDTDLLGDACDDDDDNDGFLDAQDNCRIVANDQADLDCDGTGDICDDDPDGDGLDLVQETQLGTDPTNPDSDFDTWPDGPGPYFYCDPGTINWAGGADDHPAGEPQYTIVFEVHDDLGQNKTGQWLPKPVQFEANDPPVVSLPTPDYIDNAVLPAFPWVEMSRVTVVATLKNPAGNPEFFANEVSFTIDPNGSSRKSGVAINDGSETCPGDCANDFSFDPVDRDLLSQTAPAGAPSVPLYAFDYGGWVTIVATTTLEDGTEVKGTVKLPLDSDGDDLPDYWEVTYYNSAGFDKLNKNTFSQDLSDGNQDLDQSLDNLNDGDKINSYKEYRGIILDDSEGNVVSHMRLNPMMKDLFVRGDNFKNSIPANEDPNVLDFSVAVDGGSAFEEAHIAVHDVTGMRSFSDPIEPPNIDILVVQNVTHTTKNELRDDDGFINHYAARSWSWDYKGVSYSGRINVYSYDPELNKTGTFLYHLNLMHYVYNRPYKDEVLDSSHPYYNDGPLNSDYVDLLDPVNLVEDYYLENGRGPEAIRGKKENRFRTDQSDVLDGDHMISGWTSNRYATETETYKAGYDFSVFDADGDGLVEWPAVTNAKNIAIEYGPAWLQLHTALHEMGHAAGINLHTNDHLDLMDDASLTWDRAGHFSELARSLILIHNINEY